MERITIISYVISMVLTAGFFYFIYKKKHWVFEFVAKIKEPIEQLVYVLLMFISSYVYVFLSLKIECRFNAVICSVLLLALIWITDYFFSLCFKGNEIYIDNKKRYIFMAYAGVCVSGFIIAYRERSALALEISNITISVLIGAYVSFSLLLNDGTKGRVELQTAKQKLIDKYSEVFQEHKFKSILSDFLIAFVYGTLLGVALSPAQTLIKDIDSGIAMGMVTVVVAFVGWVKVKNKLTKRKNKREDADQEKSDTE